MKKEIFSICLSVILISLNEVKSQNISMTFHNGSARPISLIIPGVMNPNLNPYSNSQVDLEVGQKVYFLPQGKLKKKELLFTVEKNWKNDTILEINQIIEFRNKPLKK